jgi:hypothetical protein
MTTKSPSDEFEKLVTELNSEDWLISDLYQTHWTSWNCALRMNGNFSSAYGQGDSPISALQKAMSNRRRPTNWKKVKEEQDRKEAEKNKPKVERVRIKDKPRTIRRGST